jgi:hypothetical protein
MARFAKLCHSSAHILAMQQLTDHILVCVHDDSTFWFSFFFTYLTTHNRDHDVEGMTDGFDAGTAYGQIDGYDDVSMGWSRSVMLGPG